MSTDTQIITKYFPDLKEDQLEQFAQLRELYVHWNAQINVISRKDIEEIYERHILHSMGIAKVMQFLPGSHVLDIGTGGGFPGIPLAIMFPQTKFHLVDSIGKKIKVVDEVAKAVGLNNLTCAHVRAENVKGKFDFIVSRAVTRMDGFYNWTKGKFKAKSLHKLPNGILYLKGGDLTAELKKFEKRTRQYELSSFFEEEFFETKKVVYVSCVK